MGRCSLVRVFEKVYARSLLSLSAILVITAILLIPALTMQPTSTASADPPAEVFDTQALIDDRFPGDTFFIGFIIESNDGNILTKQSLNELIKVTHDLKQSPQGGKLKWKFNPDTKMETMGLYTVADAVEQNLQINLGQSISESSEFEVRRAVTQVLAKDSPTRALVNTLSINSKQTAITVDDQELNAWIAPALIVTVEADNEALGGGPIIVPFGTDDFTKEEYSRDIQNILRGDQTEFSVWGIGIDVNLQSIEQGESAAPYIALTIVVVLLIVGIFLRSYWAVTTVSVGIGILIIWLKGISNLIGLESSLLNDFIVPIAMISFGVDSAFHAIGRYQSMKRTHKNFKRAFIVGLSAVFAALLLAFLSDAAAFLANTTAQIPIIVQFGIAAAIALLVSFIILGIAVPLLITKLEEFQSDSAAHSSPALWIRGIASLLSSLSAGAAVLLLIVMPQIGVVILLLHSVIFLFIPSLIVRRARSNRANTDADTDSLLISAPRQPRLEIYLGRLIVALANRRLLVLPLAVLITVGSIAAALNLKAAFDISDFFDPDSEVVIGIDKLDEHIGQRGGEPGYLYFQGDLSQPDALRTIKTGIDDLDREGSDLYARTADGDIVRSRSLLDMLSLQLATKSESESIGRSSGFIFSDEDNNQLPDSKSQINAAIDHALVNGVNNQDGVQEYSPELVRQIVWRDITSDTIATYIALQFPDTRDVKNIQLIQEDLEPRLADIERRLQVNQNDATAKLTGPPFTRQATLDASLQTLLRSFPIALLLCFLVALFFMRSLRYSVACVVPIVMVAAWLYAFMYFFGYQLNMVTSTVGAISIGIGIDYAIHFTMRFREDIQLGVERRQALINSGQTTGVALLGSAVSSAIGFAIMAFAPMPLFATFGILTAVMIIFAAAASLLVLPSILWFMAPTLSKETA